MDTGSITQETAIEFRERAKHVRRAINGLLSATDESAIKATVEFANALTSLSDLLDDVDPDR